MTLLEALTALVILGLAVVGFLGVFDGAASAARRADAAARLVSYAESRLEEATIGANGAGADEAPPRGVRVRVDRRPWPHRLTEVIVTVRSAEGDSVQLRRLARAP